MVSTLPHDGLTGIILEQHLSGRAASQHFGYNEQYLRRLRRSGRLEGAKIGRVWLIKLASLEAHLRCRQMEQERRSGPEKTL
jgi:hypothetical protein